jgi:hypothetical protein
MDQEEKSRISSPDPAAAPSMPVYEIRVKGCLDRNFWAGWFDGLEICLDPRVSETILSGPISDQAELYGLLSRLRDIGLALVSVEQIHRGLCPDKDPSLD